MTVVGICHMNGTEILFFARESLGKNFYVMHTLNNLLIVPA